MLGKALARNPDGLTEESVKEAAEAGQILLVVVAGAQIDAVMALELAQRATRRILTVLLLGGDNLAEWADDAQDTLEKLARDQGADAIEMHGRRGWVKILERHGWSFGHVTMRFEL